MRSAEWVLMKSALHLIRLIGLIVPRRLRSDWRQEWEAELRYREELLAEDHVDTRADRDEGKHAQANKRFGIRLAFQSERNRE